MITVKQCVENKLRACNPCSYLSIREEVNLQQTEFDDNQLVDIDIFIERAIKELINDKIADCVVGDNEFVLDLH